MFIYIITFLILVFDIFHFEYSKNILGNKAYYIFVYIRLLLTTGLRYRVGGDFLSKGKITIEDDVWIGTDAIILSGLTLGQGCIVAAGAVVTKSFPPYSIIGGNPARLIKKRFNDIDIEYLLDNLSYKSNIDIGIMTDDIDNFKKINNLC